MARSALIPFLPLSQNKRMIYLRKFGLAVILPIALIVQAQGQASFDRDIRRFEEADATKPPQKGGIVFVGSSSIRLWKTLEQDFPSRNVINRGFGGSQIIDNIRFAHRIVTPYEPRMVVFFAGTNDIADGRSAETVLAHYKAFVGKVREKLPETKIAYIAITPAPSRWDKVKTIRRANELIEAYCQTQPNLTFIDTASHMVDETGGPRPDLFVDDRLHLNEKGYEIWRQVIGPILDREVPASGRHFGLKTSRPSPPSRG